MSLPVTVKIKIAGGYAEKLRVEAAERRMKLTVLAAEYVMRGIDAAANDDSELAGFERRIAATVLAMRSDQEAIQAELDVIAAMLDTFVRLMLLHLPTPGSEKEATLASVTSRYEAFIKESANAFDADRPAALRKIGTLIQGRIETAEENQ
ncbi:MAG: hypothetical protein AB7T01_02240 [Acidithiobacillus sp.]